MAAVPYPHNFQSRVMHIAFRVIDWRGETSEVFVVRRAANLLANSTVSSKLVSLRVAPSFKDERVYSIVARSLFSYITSVPNFWNVICAKLFVK